MENSLLIAQCRDLAEQVLDAARARGLLLGCAESCTGGMIAAFLTAVPGSSDVFCGGVVSYWADVKSSILGVPADTIEQYGVVSEEVACAMARGAAQVLACDIAVSTTGIAGPTGAEPGKPVGTVCYGACFPGATESFTYCEGKTRDEVRLLATRRSLEILLRSIRGR